MGLKILAREKRITEIYAPLHLLLLKNLWLNVQQRKQFFDPMKLELSLILVLLFTDDKLPGDR